MLGPLRCLGLFGLWICVASSRLPTAEPVPRGPWRELFVADRLIARLAAQPTLRLYSPEPRESVLEPSELRDGNAINSVAAFPPGDRDRPDDRGSHASYLQGRDRPKTRDVACSDESPDGIHRCCGNANRLLQEPATDSRSPTTAGRCGARLLPTLLSDPSLLSLTIPPCLIPPLLTPPAGCSCSKSPWVVSPPRPSRR